MRHAEGRERVAGRERYHPRSPKWLSMVRSEAVQRMAMASRVNIAFPSRPLSPAFSVEQCSSDAVTRGGKFESPRGFLRR